MGTTDLQSTARATVTWLEADWWFESFLFYDVPGLGMAVSLPVFSTLWSAQEAEKIRTPQELSKILHNGILSAVKHGGEGRKDVGGKKNSESKKSQYGLGLHQRSTQLWGQIS